MMGARCARREVSDIRARGLALKSRVSRVPAARVFESPDLEIFETIHTRRGIPRGNRWQNSQRIVAALKVTEWNEAVDEESEGARAGMNGKVTPEGSRRRSIDRVLRMMLFDEPRTSGAIRGVNR